MPNIEGLEGVEGITLRVTKNELLLMTEDNQELLGFLRENFDLENLRTKGVARGSLNLRESKLEEIKGN